MDRLYNQVNRNSQDVLEDPSTRGVGGLSGINTAEGAGRELARQGEVPQEEYYGTVRKAFEQNYNQGDYAPITYGLDGSYKDPNYEELPGDNFIKSAYSNESNYELKAQDQSSADKWANGILKFVTTAGITATKSTLGLANGIVESVANDDISYMYRNTTNAWLSELEKRIENEWLPNYYTKEELDRPWYQNILSANFLADGVIKNMGFTVGAVISGSGFALVAKSLGAGAMAAQLLGGLYDAYSEGNIEAGQTYEEFIEQNKTKDEEFWRQTTEDIIRQDKLDFPERYPEGATKYSFENEEPQYNAEGKEIKLPQDPTINKPSPNAISKLNDLKAMKEYSADNIEEQAKHAANVNAVLNTLFLSLPITKVFGRLFKGGYNSTRNLRKHVKMGADGMLKGKPKKLAKEVITDGGWEAFEESTQGFTDEYSQTYYGNKLDEYRKALVDPKYKAENVEYIDAILDAAKNSYGDIDTYDEAFMGFTSAILGFPMVNVQSGRRSERGGRWLDWYGGLAEHHTLTKEFNERLQKHVNYANERSTQFADFTDNFKNSKESMDFIFNNNLQKRFDYKENKAIEEGDKVEFLNAVHSNLIADIVYFDNMGRLDQYEEMLEAALDHSELNLKEIAVMSAEVAKDGRYVGPFIDANGKPMTLQKDGQEAMKEKLTKQVEYIKQTVKDYKELGDFIDKRTHVQLSDEQLQEMIWLGSNIRNWDNRISEMNKSNKEVFSEAYEIIKSLVDSNEQSDVELNTHQENIRAIMKQTISSDAQVRQNIANILFSLGKIQGMSDQQYKQYLKENPKFLTNFIDILNNKLFTLDKYKLQDTKERIEDSGRIMKDIADFQERFDAFLADPNLMKENHDKIDKEISNKQYRKELKESLKRFGSIKNYKDFVYTLINQENSEDLLDALVATGNKHAQNFARVKNAYYNIIKGIRESEDLTDIEKSVAIEQLNNAMLNEDKFEDFINPESESYNPENQDNYANTPDMITDDTKFKISDYIKGLLGKYKEDNKWKEKFKSRYRKKQEELKKDPEAKHKPKEKDKKKESKDKPKSKPENKQKNTNKNEGIGKKLEVASKQDNYLSKLNNIISRISEDKNIDNLNKYIEESGLKLDPALNKLFEDTLQGYLDGKYSYTHTVDILTNQPTTHKDDTSKTSFVDLEKSSVQKDDRQELVYKNKEHLYDAIQELKVVEGTLVPFEEHLPQFKGIIDFLKSKNKFDFVNNGNLKEGDEIRFTVFKKYNKENKQDAIFMTTKDGQVVGVLQENTANGEVAGLKELREDILAKNKKSSAAVYTYDITTTVNTIMDGKTQFTESEQDLKDVKDLDASNSVLSVMSNGVVTANNSKVEATSPQNIVGKDGRIYLQIETASGKRFPVMVRVKSLREVNINSQEFQKTETYKQLMSAINAMAEATNEEQMLAAREKLSKILYIDNIKTNFRVNKFGKPFLSIVKVFTDEFGSEVTEYNRKLKKEVRKEDEYKPIDLKDTSTKVVEFGDNGPGTDITQETQTPTEQIANSILTALIHHGASFQVSKNLINTPGYNERLINDGILTANISSVKQKSAWFIANPIIDGKSVKVDYKGAIKGNKVNPLDNSKANKFRVDGKDYSVIDNKIYDKDGNLQSDLPNGQLILDLDWAQKVYGNATQGLGLKNGVCLIENTGRVLDRKKHKYLDGKAKEDFLKSIGKETKGNRVSNKPKDTSISEIEKQIEDNQTKVDKSRTDGDYYYILEEDGEYHQYSRVTQYIGSNFTIPTALQEKIDRVQEALALVKNSEDADKTYKELIDEFGVELPEFEFGGSINDNNRKVFNVVKEKILSNIPNRNRSLKTGTAVDGIIRDFFQGVENIPKPDNISTFAFKELLSTLQNIKKTMEDSGERFLTNNIVLYHKYADGTRVAGEVDILSVNDSTGQINIYDVKTSKNSFYSEDGSLHPYFINPYNKGQRSTLEQYTMQLSGYKNLFESQYGYPVTNLALLPFLIEYDGENADRIIKQEGIPITFNPKVNIRKEVNIPSTQLEKAEEYKPKVTPKEYTDETKGKFGIKLEDVEGYKQEFIETKSGEVILANTLDLGNFFGMGIRVAVVPVYNKQKPAMNQFYIVLPNGYAIPKYRQGFVIPVKEGIAELNKVLNDPDENVNGKQFLIKFNNKKTSLNPESVSDSKEVKDIKEDENDLPELKPTNAAEQEVKNSVDAITEAIESLGSEENITPEQKKTDDEIAQKLLNNKRTAGNKTAAQKAKERREARKNKFGKSKKNKESLERKVDDPSRKIWNKEKEMSWMENALPQLSSEERLHIQEGLIEVSSKGVKAWGQFIDNIIKLSDVAAEGTLYHEAFHGVFNLLMSPEERSSTLDFVRNLKGNNSKSQTALEEIMAEDFRIYATTRNSFLGKAKQSIKDFFNKILTFVNLKEDTSVLTSLYKNIYDGKYANAQINLEQKISREFFHGSAAQEIDEFSYDFLLQGEGVNAFTAGFYFTETNAEANMYRIRALASKQDNVLSMLSTVLNTVKSSLEFGSLDQVQYSYLSSLSTVIGAIQRYAIKMNKVTNAEKLNNALQNRYDALITIFQGTSDINIFKQLSKQSEELSSKLAESDSRLQNLKDNLNSLNRYTINIFEEGRIFSAYYLLGDIIKQGEILRQTNEGGLFKIELQYSNDELIHLDQDQNHESSKAIISTMKDFYMQNLNKEQVKDVLLYMSNKKLNKTMSSKASELLNNIDSMDENTAISEMFDNLIYDDSRKVISLIKYTESIFSYVLQTMSTPDIQKELTKHYLKNGFVGASHFSGFSKSDHIIMYDTSRIKNKGNILNSEGKVTKTVYDALLNEFTDNQKIPTVDDAFENKIINVPDNLMGDIENGIDVINSNNILGSLLNTQVENIDKVLSKMSAEDIEYIGQLFSDEVFRLHKTGATILGNRFLFEDSAELYIDSSKDGKKLDENVIDLQNMKLSDLLYKDKFTKPEVKGLHEVLSTYLSHFGVNLLDANKVIGENNSIIDFTNKIIYAKDKESIPSNAGIFIAFMMQKNPIVQNLFMQIAKEENKGKSNMAELKKHIENNPIEYSRKLGNYLGKALRTEYSRLENDKSFKNKLSQVIQVIKDFFNKLVFKDKLFFKMQNDLFNIANNILNNNTDIVNEGLNLYNDVAVKVDNYTIGGRNPILDGINDILNIRDGYKSIFSLSGASALMFYGSIYRPFGAQFTSVDVVASNSFSNKEILNKLGSRFGYVVKDVIDNNSVNNGTQTINTSVIISRDGYKVYRQGDAFINDQLELVGTLDVENNIINIAENQKYKYDILNLNIHKETSRSRKALIENKRGELSSINIQEYKNIINNMLGNITNQNIYDYNNFKNNGFRRSDMSHISSTLESMSNDINSSSLVSNLLNTLDNSNKFSLLSTESKMELTAQNISEQMYNKMSDLEIESLNKCLGID